MQTRETGCRSDRQLSSGQEKKRRPLVTESRMPRIGQEIDMVT